MRKKGHNLVLFGLCTFSHLMKSLQAFADTSTFFTVSWHGMDWVSNWLIMQIINSSCTNEKLRTMLSFIDVVWVIMQLWGLNPHVYLLIQNPPSAKATEGYVQSFTSNNSVRLFSWYKLGSYMYSISMIVQKSPMVTWISYLNLELLSCCFYKEVTQNGSSVCKNFVAEGQVITWLSA